LTLNEIKLKINFSGTGPLETNYRSGNEHFLIDFWCFDDSCTSYCFRL